jgi:hypothetical protein
MGNCVKKETFSKEKKIFKMFQPSFYYFCEKKMQIFKFSGISAKGCYELDTSNLNEKIIPVYFNDQFIYLIGKSKSLDSDNPKCFKFDTTNQKLLSISSIPSTIYISEIITNFSEIFTISANPLNIHIYSPSSDSWSNLDIKSSTFRSLSLFSSIIFEENLLIFCGIHLNQEFSLEVYAINLLPRSKVTHVPEFCSPCKLIEAKGFYRNGKAFIAGGKTDRHGLNRKVFVSKDFKTWQGLDIGLSSLGSECFFSVFSGFTCCLRYPELMVWKKGVLSSFYLPKLKI